MRRSQSQRPNQLFAKAVRLQESGDFASALKLYEKILKRVPRDRKLLHNAGLAALQTGKLKRGVGYLDQALRQDPDDVTVLRSLGAGHYEMGDFDSAAANYARLVEIKPADPIARLQLASSLRQLGRLEEARECTQAVLELDPASVPAMNFMGNLLVELGRPAEGIEVLQRGLAAAPQAPELRQSYALALCRDARRDEALPLLRELLVSPSISVHGQLALASALRDIGQGRESVVALRAIVVRHPDAASAWDALANTLPTLDPAELSEQDLLDTAFCLGRFPDRAPGLSRLLCRAYAREPLVIAFLEAPELASMDAILGLLEQETFMALLRGPFVADPDVERLLTGLRRRMLRELADPEPRGASRQPTLAFLSAMACQCFEGEYVFQESPEETSAVARLEARMPAGLKKASEPERARDIAMLASYRALSGISGCRGITRKEAAAFGSDFAALVRLQLEAPLQEAKLRSRIRALTAIDDEVSMMVGAQYEDSPYPRWRGLEPIAERSLRDRMLAAYPQLGEAKSSWPQRPEILVAGCGTGRQAIRIAQLYAGARVLAMDLSRTSLGYAARLAGEHGATGIEFLQGDILETTSVHRSFDVVACTGVLHHLADPENGWRLLLDRLRPGGLMQVGLYSKLARRSVTAARAFAREHGWSGSAKDIRDFRTALSTLPEEHPARPVSRFRDFYSLSECRDLVFHPQEVGFDIPRIDRFIERESLQFVGFEFSDWRSFGVFKREHPELASECSLDLWDRFEQEHPDTFAAMYVFWLLKPEQ